MTARERRIGSLVCGAGGALMIASLFMPWATAGDSELDGRGLLLAADVLLAITGVTAIAAALSGGRIGLFRPDLSLNGAADLLGLVSVAVFGWLITGGFPEGAEREIGVFAALIGAIFVAFGAADYGTLRGDPLFPRLDDARIDDAQR